MFYAVDAGYNPNTNYYWVEIKEFNDYDEDDDYNNSLDQPRYCTPVELTNDYESSLEMLQNDYGYPDYAIKNLSE